MIAKIWLVQTTEVRPKTRPAAVNDVLAGLYQDSEMQAPRETWLRRRGGGWWGESQQTTHRAIE